MVPARAAVGVGEAIYWYPPRNPGGKDNPRFPSESLLLNFGSLIRASDSPTEVLEFL